MCILFVLPQNVVFAATQKSFSYVKESEIFSCNYNMITDGASSVDSSMSPRLYGPFLDTDRIFKGEGPDGTTCLLMQAPEKNGYATLRYYMPEQYRNLSAGIIVFETDIKVSSTKDEYRMAEGMAGLEAVLGTDGKILGSYPYKRGVWFNLKIALNFEANLTEIYYNNVFAASKKITGNFAPEYFTCQLAAKGSECPSLWLDNTKLYKAAYLADKLIVSADFTGYNANGEYVRLDSFINPACYAPALDTNGTVFYSESGKNGEANSAFCIKTTQKNLYPQIRMYLADEFKNINSGKIILEMNLKLGTNGDKFRLSNGFGLSWSDSDIFNAEGTVLGTPYSSGVWNKLKIFFDYDEKKAFISLNDIYCGYKEIADSFCPSSLGYVTFQFWSVNNDEASVTIDDFIIYKPFDIPENSVYYYSNGSEIQRIQGGTVRTRIKGVAGDDSKIISVLYNEKNEDICDIKVGSDYTNIIVPMYDTYDYRIDTYILKSETGDFLEKISYLDGNMGTNYLSGATVISDVKRRYPGNAHPRLIFTEEKLNEILYDYTGETYRNIDSAITYRANRYLNMTPVEYKLEGAYNILLNASREILDRVMSLSEKYLLTGNNVYAERAYLELENAANFPDWSPKHFLDTAEMLTAFAFGYDWLYDYLTPQRRETLRNAMVNKGLKAGYEDYTDSPRTRTYKWYQDMPGDNWKFVCNAGLTLAALAICDETEESLCSDIITYGFSDAYKAVRNMFDENDGSYSEGLTYWTYASNYLAYYSSALQSAAGTDYGLTEYEGLRKSCDFVKNLSSNVYRSFNFGDAEEGIACSQVLLWYGKRFKRYDVSASRANYPALHPMDLLWYSKDECEGVKEYEYDYGEIGGSNAAFRSSWDKNGFYASIHFGENDAYHAQADTGTFVMEYMGKRFFSDLGQDNYSAYEYEYTYRYRAEGHNTLVINPNMNPISSGKYTDAVVKQYRDQAADSHCYITGLSSNNESRYAYGDISDAYFGKKAVRGMKMSSDGKSVVIRDELKLNDTDSGYWFAHTKADIALSADKKSAVLTIDGVKLWVGILSEGLTFEIMDAIQLNSDVIPTDDTHSSNDSAYRGQKPNDEFKKLAISFSGSTDISVAFVPLSGNQTRPDIIPSDSEIKNW